MVFIPHEKQKGQSRPQPPQAQEQIGAVLLLVGPSIGTRTSGGVLFTSDDWRFVTGWPNRAVQMFEPAGAHHNPVMMGFINSTLHVRALLERDNGPGFLEFRAGLFRVTNEPFVVLGPVTHENMSILQSLTHHLPPNWIHMLAHEDISSIAEEAT